MQMIPLRMVEVLLEEYLDLFFLYHKREYGDTGDDGRSEIDWILEQVKQQRRRVAEDAASTCHCRLMQVNGGISDRLNRAGCPVHGGVI